MTSDSTIDYLYFARSGGSVKIGVSHEPRKRIKDLSCAHSKGIRLLKVVPGRRRGIYRLESDLHKKFDALRLKGEWFKWGEPIRSFLEEVEQAEDRYVRGVTA